MGIPRAELEPVEGLVLPSERPPGYFFPVEDRVVVFGHLGGGCKGLKRGTVDHLTDNGNCVIVDLDVKPPRRFGRSSTYGQYASKQGMFVVRFNEPTIMKESEFLVLHRNAEQARRWVGGMTDARSKEALRRALVHNGITEVAAKSKNVSDIASSLLR